MIKLLIFISGLLFYILPLSAQNESINTSAVNSSNGEESPYLFVEGGKRTEKPKTVEEQISSYSIEQVNAMIIAYNTKLDYVNDLSKNGNNYDAWKKRVIYELDLLNQRKKILQR